MPMEYARIVGKADHKEDDEVASFGWQNGSREDQNPVVAVVTVQLAGKQVSYLPLFCLFCVVDTGYHIPQLLKKILAYFSFPVH